MLNSGVDVVTTGNHVWDQREFLPHLDSDYPIIRPVNYPDGVPGRGYLIAQDVLIVNAMGRTFMPAVDCPFRAMDKLLSTFSTLPAYYPSGLPCGGHLGESRYGLVPRRSRDRSGGDTYPRAYRGCQRCCQWAQPLSQTSA